MANMVLGRLSVGQALLLVAVMASRISAYTPMIRNEVVSSDSVASNRRAFFSKAAAVTLGTITASKLSPQLGGEAQAVGPIKLNLLNPIYSAKPCPKDKPIPGEKAMKGMRGLCVSVEATLEDFSPKELDKVGVYGFITDAVTGDSVLANNPDLSTDAGQFTIVDLVTTTDKTVLFEFVAAVPMEKDISQEENGIGKLKFGSLRLVSYPGGQQYGSISPCEMNEFSQECEDWEETNGEYTKGNFMIKSNSRTKGR